MKTLIRHGPLKLHRIKGALGGGASRVLRTLFCLPSRTQHEVYRQIDTDKDISRETSELEGAIYERPKETRISSASLRDEGCDKYTDVRLPTLPGEIVIMIIRALPAETVDDLQYLKSLSTISPLLRSATQTVLFRHLTTRPFHSFAFQASFIYSSPHIASSIRVLSILPRAITAYNLSSRLSEFVVEPHPNSQLALQKAAAVRLYHLISACEMLEEIQLLFCGEGNGSLISDFSQRGMMKAFAGVMGRVKLRKLRKIVLFKCDQEIAEMLVRYEENSEGGFAFTTRERSEDSLGYEPKNKETPEDGTSNLIGTVHWHVWKPLDIEVPFSKTLLEENLARVETMDVVNWILPVRRVLRPSKIHYSMREFPLTNCDNGISLDRIEPDSTIQTIDFSVADSRVFAFMRIPAQICNKQIRSNTTMKVTSLSLSNLQFSKEILRLFRSSGISHQLQRLELSRVALEMFTIDGMPHLSSGTINVRWCELFGVLKTQARRLEELKIRSLGYTCFNVCNLPVTLCGGKEGWQDDEKKLKELLAEIKRRNELRGLLLEEGMKEGDLTICTKHTQ